VIAARAALRTLPLLSRGAGNRSDIALLVFRAASIAWLAASYPKRGQDAPVSALYAADAARAPSIDARDAAHAAYAAYTAGAASAAADAAAAAAAAAPAATAAAAAAGAAMAAAKVFSIESLPTAWIFQNTQQDAEQLLAGMAAFRLTRAPLWSAGPPPALIEAWAALSEQLLKEDHHGSIWIRWYDSVLSGGTTEEAEDEALTDIPGELPWVKGAEAVNAEIARRLAELRPLQRSPDVLDQALENSIEPAPPESDLPTVPAQRPAAIEPIWDAGILKIPPRPAKPDSSRRKFASALKSLRAELSEFADEISGEANIDQRFVAQLRRLVERIPPKMPRQDELFRIGHRKTVLESYAKIVQEEWPNHLAARYHALVLHFDRTMRQSPEWRDFERNAFRLNLTEQEISEAALLAKEIATALKDEDARRFVDPALPEAIELLAEVPEPTTSQAKELLAADRIDSVNNVLKRIAEAAIVTTKPLASARAAAGSTLSKAGKGFATEFGKGLIRGAKKEGKRAGEDAVKWLRRIVIIGGSAAVGSSFGLPALIAKFPTIADWLMKISHFL
jgi:hypothetical protein